MANETVKIDDDLIVEIPSDTIQLGTDPDGLPRTDPSPAAKDKVAADRAGDNADGKKSVADLAALKRERDAAARERDDASARAAQAEENAARALAAKSEAEQTAGLRTTQALRAHAAKVVAEYQQITGALASTKAQVETARQAYIAAREAGDAAREAAAMEAMADAKAAIVQLESGQVAAEAEVRRVHELANAPPSDPAPRRDDPAPQKPETPDDWINKARTAIGDEGASWLRSHKEFVTDPKLNKKLLRFADEYADDNGPNSLKSAEFRKALDAKFFADEVDVTTRDAPNDADAEPEAPKAKVKPKTASAAPVSRSSSLFSSRNLDASQVRLPPKLAKFVKDAGLNPTEYALGAVADIKAGRLPKNYLDPDYDHGV